MTEIRVDAVRKSYGGVAAVEDVSFTVAPGEFLTLLGPSGCGKTTTLRMVAGFVTPTSGRIHIAGRDVTDTPPHHREIGLVFQSYALFPHMTVAGNVAFGLTMRRCSKAETAARTNEALALVKLDGLGDRFPRQLSGGQQQRVALARALVIRPQVLLLDEPLAALDKHLRDHMRRELGALQRRLGIATIFVTHDQEEALSMSDRVAVMRQGRIEQIGTPRALYERPETRFVAEFLGRSNLIEVEVTGRADGLARLRAGAIEMMVDAAACGDAAVLTILVRPERVRIAAASAGGIAAHVVSAGYLGALIECRLELAGGQMIDATVPNTDAALSIVPGAAVSVTIPPEAIRVIGSV